MLIRCFYIFNVLFLFSGIFGGRLTHGGRRFSLILIQLLAGIPLLAGEYLYLARHFDMRGLRLVLFAEIVCGLAVIFMVWRPPRLSSSGTRLYFFIESLVGATVALMAGDALSFISVSEPFYATLSFAPYGSIYFSALFVLIVVLYIGWCIEQFWRGLDGAGRWMYKFFVVGSCLACVALVWHLSYRLTYLTLLPRHFFLLALLLIGGWLLMVSAVICHRLLNRQLFVSRKVVYAFVLPSLLGVYLLGFGMVSFLMRTFGLELSYILAWLLVALGGIGIGLFALSGTIRRRAHFFISTHFYINKYEYRDEWLAFSKGLQGVFTEMDVVRALEAVLMKSLYTTEIFIWIGSVAKGYQMVASPGGLNGQSPDAPIDSHDPLVTFFKDHACFHLKERVPDLAWQEVRSFKGTFLASLGLTLLAPIAIGPQLVGVMGLGPEFTGGEYGDDDFDLLTALGGQAASSLLAVRMADELAHAREKHVWRRFSSFVLHDIKNAVTMLSLLQENAPAHIHKPEFQRDMLELVDEVLLRMGRVEKRLMTTDDEVKPVNRSLDLGFFLDACWQAMETRLASMACQIECRDDIEIHTDPGLLSSILENLLLNAFEAGGTVVTIRAGLDGDLRAVVVVIYDDGPGIAEGLLPDRLFEPFKTTKEGGSGIGLWQARRVAVSLGGDLSAENNRGGGACFVIHLPLDVGVG